MIRHKKTGASLLGTIVVLLLLALQTEAVLAAPGCPSESNPRVGAVGGRRFEIFAYVALPDELADASTRCTRPNYAMEFDPVAAFRFAALTKTSRPVDASVVIVIDDFGYRNDWVVEGFLKLDSALTFAVIPGHQYSGATAARADQLGYE
ncbi:MAG: divergent polysaccharide deacetylase family protein, partial [Gammaproteobacteria bacterium]|nr:divergent polysaccharide deacetylase family protein [Gammaproteobacteria bacterium]